MTITVYLGASPSSDDVYKEAVKTLGTWIGENGHDLVYGGSHSGLMGLLADAALAAGAHVTGIEPSFFIDAQVQHTGIDELIVVDTMAERRSKMIERGDAFIAFPGGVGTLDEISEIIVMDTLGLMNKPCVIYNVNGYFDLLEAYFDHMVGEGFLSAERRAMVSFVRNTAELGDVLAGTASEQIRRISRYEAMMREAERLMAAEKLSAEKAIELRGLIDELENYYGSDFWKRDFADDEAGLLPAGLRRGVLSEDGLYNLLETYREWDNDPAILCLGPLVLDMTAAHLPGYGNWLAKQRIETISSGVGGDAANQAIHLASLGYHACLCACIGDDENGRMLLSAVRDRGVDTSFVRAKSGIQTGSAMVLVEVTGERHTFSVAGAHATLNREDLPELTSSYRAISLASLFSMEELEADGLLDYLLDARSQGIPVFADLGSDKKKQGLAGIRRFLPYIDYFVPSLYDVQTMAGAESAEACAAFFRKEGVGAVVIKCGAAGAYVDGREFRGGEFRGWIPSPDVDVVDTTGAGDCLSAAFLTRILEGDSLKEAARFACAAGAYSTQFVGANAFDLTEELVFNLMKAE